MKISLKATNEGKKHNKNDKEKSEKKINSAKQSQVMFVGQDEITVGCLQILQV